MRLKIALKLFLCSLAITALISPLIARAAPGAPLSDDEQHALHSFPNEVTTAGGQCSAANSDGGDDVSGPNIKVAYEFFLGKGFNAAQAAGIVGNFDEESGVDPTKGENDGTGGNGYGIAQFTPPTAMETWVTAQGQDPHSLQGQLNYIAHAIEGYSTQQMKTTSTPEDAASMFMNTYEHPNPAYAHEDIRRKDARNIYNKYSGDSSITPVDALDSGGCQAVSSTSPDCTNATKNALILCDAKLYNNIFYRSGGGHDYTSFRSGCPISALATAAKDSSAANPGPCATDCSGLVSVAVDQAFNQTFSWTVGDDGSMQGAGADNWKPVAIKSVQPGDIVTKPGHVEIVDHYNADSDALTTFGSHQTGEKTGPVTTTGYFSAAYRWTGPGAS